MNNEIVEVSLMKNIKLNERAKITSIKQAEQNIIALEGVVVDQIVKLKDKIDFYFQVEYEGPYRDYVNIERGETIETKCIPKIAETMNLLRTLKGIYAGSYVDVYEQVKIDDGVEEALFGDPEFSYEIPDILKMLYGYIQNSAEVKDYHISFRVRIIQNVGHCGSINKDIMEIRIEGIQYKGFLVSWDVKDKTTYDCGTDKHIRFGDYFMDRNFNIFSEEKIFDMMNQYVG